MNISSLERAGRVIAGLAGVVVGVLLLASASTAWALALLSLLVLAGLDLLITGALGHCPLYHRLGHTPRSSRRPA